MLIGIITDTHWGIRGNNELFHDNNKLFLENVFFPTLDKENITTVIHLGDLVDKRKDINFNTANRLRNDFLEPLNNREIDTHIIVGNHDCYYKNTNSLNALNELVGNHYNKIRYYNDVDEITIDGDKILLVPWICDENREKTFNRIGRTDAKICMGHLELVGFQMYKGSFSIEGDDPKDFNKFDIVLSGHYHHRSNSDNIYYLGSHSEFTWADYNDARGFHIFDTKTKKLRFIKNPYTVFKKIFFKNNEQNNEDLNVKNCIVKVIVQSKENSYNFDKFIDDLEKQNPVELQIIEDQITINENNDLINEAESTIDIFKKYIKTNEFNNVDKHHLEKIIIELYHESLSLE